MQRKFLGIWIPAWMWETKELPIMEKIFFLEIQSLDNDQGCYASNAHFSKLFDVSKTHCSKIIKALEAKGWITIELQYKGRQVVKRICRVVDNFEERVGAGEHTPMLDTTWGYEPEAKERYTNSINTKKQNPKTPTASAVGLFKPVGPLYELANVYLRELEQKRFVTALVGDVTNEDHLRVLGNALKALSVRDEFEPLRADDAIGYCKAALYKGSKNQ